MRIKLEALGLRDYFAQLVTGQDVAHHKPDPEAYLLAAERLGVDGKKCVVIEDSAAGVAAGKAAGCAVIGFTRFNNDKRPLKGAALTVDSWGELSYSRLSVLPA
ncbi:MAG: Hydrolase, haloacid dehalogenase-like family [Patescibacteria group bacterium]|nr:Hydrolase, haloacid dehalogenase-like family [Patescibacteria group bacterium]